MVREGSCWGGEGQGWVRQCMSNGRSRANIPEKAGALKSGVSSRRRRTNGGAGDSMGKGRHGQGDSLNDTRKRRERWGNVRGDGRESSPAPPPAPLAGRVLSSWPAAHRRGLRATIRGWGVLTAADFHPGASEGRLECVRYVAMKRSGTAQGGNAATCNGFVATKVATACNSESAFRCVFRADGAKWQKCVIMP